MYTKDSEWKYLIELTQSKIATSNSRQELQCLYTQIMKGKFFQYIYVNVY